MADDEVFDQENLGFIKFDMLGLDKEQAAAQMNVYALASSPLQVTMVIDELKDRAVQRAHVWLGYEHLSPESRRSCALWELEKAAIRIKRLTVMSWSTT